ncbi:TolC family protein [Massilia sp. LXY-6]|uniref:TolC family protein n=1 Tax=Massilia sp. LXY-6 TaxID=3379823 RepID=UPI003EE23003
MQGVPHTIMLALACCLAAGAASAQSLHLDEALALAGQRNHDLKAAAIAVDSAAASVTSAAAAPNPTLTLQTMNINPAAGIGSGPLRAKTVDSAVRIDQLIERGGKRRLRTAAAEQLEHAARADLADSRRLLRREVAGAYYDLLAAQQRATLTLEAAALADHAMQAAETRRRAGDLAGGDTARLRTDTLRVHNDADDAAADLDQARRALALLLGLDDAGGLSAADAWPAALPASAAAALDAALEARADVAAARARVRAAQASHELALAGRTRDVTVGVQLDHYPASAANPQGSGNSIGVSVQVPLFVRYAMQGEIRSAAAALDAASENLAKVRQNARADIGKARAQAEAGARRVERYDGEILPAARKAAEAAEFAFAHGAAGVMDVLDVRRAYRAAQLDALAAHADFAKSLAALDAALSREHP